MDPLISDIEFTKKSRKKQSCKVKNLGPNKIPDVWNLKKQCFVRYSKNKKFFATMYVTQWDSLTDRDIRSKINHGMIWNKNATVGNEIS